MSVEAIPNCVPNLVGNEREYLRECIESGWVSSVGPFVERFEELFAAYHAMPGAVAVASGTAAIHLGLLALGVKPGDLVICPTMTFVGTANPVRYCGADPIFVDVDEESLNIDASVLLRGLESETERRHAGLIHRPTGRRIAALIAVHLYGNPANMERLMAISGRYSLPVLEDAAESLGARFGGQLVGSIGDIGCFSFNGNKVITTGGGGMIISKDPQHLKGSKHLSTQARIDPFEFVHDEIGYNYRMSNLAAALGVAQFEHLDEFIDRKREHAETYRRAVEGEGLWEIVQEPSGARGTYWMILARRRFPAASILPLLKEIAGSGIGVRPVWLPLHRLPMFKQCAFWGNGVADRLYERVCCLPSSVGLRQDQILRAARTLNESARLTSAMT